MIVHPVPKNPVLPVSEVTHNAQYDAYREKHLEKKENQVQSLCSDPPNEKRVFLVSYILSNSCAHLRSTPGATFTTQDHSERQRMN